MTKYLFFLDKTSVISGSANSYTELVYSLFDILRTGLMTIGLANSLPNRTEKCSADVRWMPPPLSIKM
jgi:hypothetical protein